MKPKFMRPLVLAALIGLTLATVVSAQKAEPRRIQFAKGKNSKTVTGVLSNNQEYDFVVGASEGQLLEVWISSRPKGKFHSFSILGIDGIDFATDYDVNYSVKRRLPKTGDYLITVVKRPTRRVKTARFYLTVRIRN